MKKHSTDGMQPRHNSLIYACIYLLIAAAIKAASYSSTKNRMCVCVCECVWDELHEYGDLPDGFSNDMNTNRACEARAQWAIFCRERAEMEKLIFFCINRKE